MPSLDYSLYLATDVSFFSHRGESEALQILEDCINAGVTLLQLRLKDTPARSFYEIGRHIRSLTRRRQVPLIINDRADLALALQADGVHVGRSDLPPEVVRRLLPKAVIGYSVNTLEHLHYAHKAGVDYVGVGPVFATATKSDTGPVTGLEGLRRIVSRAAVPCVAIGGITERTAAAPIQAGAAGICVISAILGTADPVLATRHLRERIDAA